MKIAYCIPQLYHPGGIERVIVHKANYLAEKLQYDICIITVENKGHTPYYNLYHSIKHIDLGIHYCDILSLPIYNRIIARNKLKKEHKRKLKAYLLKNKFDIVISTFQQEASFLYKIKDGSKKIIECHFCKGYRNIIAQYYHLPFLTKLAYKYQSWYDEHTLPKHYDKMVVLTEEDLNNWKPYINDAICISNPLSFIVKQKAALVNKKVIAVGRLDAQKGFDRLLPIWKKVVEKCPEWHLNIFGQGEDEMLLKKIICNLNIKDFVTLNPPSKNIQEQFLDSSINVMTSRFEGFGLVLTEAMECGVPCVSFEFPCGAKDIITNGIDGFCIKNGDDDDFVNKLLLLMQNPDLRKNLGTNAKKNVQRYSDENIMTKWVKLFNDLIK